MTERLVTYLAEHPGSTSGDVLDALGLADMAETWEALTAAERAGAITRQRGDNGPWRFYSR